MTSTHAHLSRPTTPASIDCLSPQDWLRGILHRARAQKISGELCIQLHEGEPVRHKATLRQNAEKLLTAP